jgi:hypothetical protein
MNTNRDFASKEWIAELNRREEDAFQSVPPDLAIFLLICGGVLGYVLGVAI